MRTGNGREERPVFSRDNPPSSESRPSCCVCGGTTFKTDQGIRVDVFSAREEPALFVKMTAAELYGQRDPIAYLMDRVCCRRCWIAKGQPNAFALSDVLSDLGVSGLHRFAASDARDAQPGPAPTVVVSEPEPLTAPALSRRPKAPPPSRIEQFERRYGKPSPHREKAAQIVASSGPSGSVEGGDASERWTLADHLGLKGLRFNLQSQAERHESATAEEQEGKRREAEAEAERKRREAEAVMIAEGRATVLPDNTVVPRLKRRRPRPQKLWSIRLKGVIFAEGKRNHPKYGVDVERFGTPPVEVPRGVEPLKHIATGEVSAGVKTGCVSAVRHSATAVCEIDDGDRMASLVLGLMALDKEPFATPREAYAVIEQMVGFHRLIELWNAAVSSGQPVAATEAKPPVKVEEDTAQAEAQPRAEA